MKKIIKYFNYLVFLLAITTVLVSLCDILIPIYIPYKEYLITPFLEVIMIFILLKDSHLKIYKQELLLYIIVLLPLLIIYLWEPFRYMIYPGRNPIFIYVSFFNLFIFFFYYILNIARDPSFYLTSLKLYWGLNYVIAVVSIIIFFLLHLGLIKIDSWGLPTSFGLNYRVKYNIEGAVENIYSVPFGISVILPYYHKPLGFLSEFGTFSGLSYEPHLATFFMTPAYFLTFYFYKNNLKSFFYYHLPFILFFLLASSLTNILALGIVGVIMFIVTLDFKRIGSRIILLYVVLIGIYIFFIEYYEPIYSYINYKIEGRSTEETVGFTNYILNPSKIIGWGAFNTPTYFSNKSHQNIGLISTFLILYLYITLLFLIIKNYFKKNYVFMAIGLYIFLHSLKFPLHILHFPFLVFILLIITIPIIDRYKMKYLDGENK